VERIEAIGQQGGDDRTLRRRILDELHRVVPFDVHAWLLTDPETEVGSAPLADAPVPADLPRLIRAKYLTPPNRWTHLAVPVASLQRATDGVLARSFVWSEVLSSYGVSDVASVVFRDRHGCWGWLDLWRIGGDAFSVDELGHLTATTDSITKAIRQSQTRTFDHAPSDASRSGPVVLVLSPLLDVKAQTPETEQYLRALVPPGGGQRPIPAGAFNVAAQLLAVEAGVDGHEPSARVHLGEGRWLMLRAARVGAADSGDTADIAVTIEEAALTERRSLFTRSHALSPRETDVIEQLATGADTRAIAEVLFVSEYTVQDHLKSIYFKTGTRTRRALLARIAGS
jgi:DNA-binding CsgD family transcriptional regulator